MSFKTKALGLVAATVLSLSLTTGVMADDSTDVTASLRGGSCTIVLTSTGTLGVWDFNGTEYVPRTELGTTVNLSGNLNAGTPAGCDVTVTFGGLGSGAIGLQYFSGSLTDPSGTTIVSGGPLNGSGLDTGILGTDIPTGVYTGTLTLDDVPNNIQPANYSGVVSVTISNAT